MRVKLGYPIADTYRVAGSVTGTLYTFSRDMSTEVDPSDVPGLLALTLTQTPCCGGAAQGIYPILQAG